MSCIRAPTFSTARRSRCSWSTPSNHPAACINYDPSHFLLQQLDYCAFIELYGKRISGFHVKDAEFRPSGRVGVYGGYQPWAKRAGRFRSLGDGQVDFKRVFTLLTEAGFDGWAVLEWECCVKSPEQGAREGAPFIARQSSKPTTVAFDDFAGGRSDAEANREMLGLRLRRTRHGNLETQAAHGMVGGGQGAFIGAVHRMAATLDRQVEWSPAVSRDLRRTPR